MKGFKRLIMAHIKISLPFTGCTTVCVSLKLVDWGCHILCPTLHFSLSHLDKRGTYARMLVRIQHHSKLIVKPLCATGPCTFCQRGLSPSATMFLAPSDWAQESLRGVYSVHYCLLCWIMTALSSIALSTSSLLTQCGGTHQPQWRVSLQRFSSSLPCAVKTIRLWV